MPTEVNKCIFRGSNSVILNSAALVSGVQLLLKVHILPLTPLWKGFCQPGKKVVPLCDNGKEKTTWFTQITTFIKLEVIFLQSGAIQIYVERTPGEHIQPI